MTAKKESTMDEGTLTIGSGTGLGIWTIPDLKVDALLLTLTSQQTGREILRVSRDKQVTVAPQATDAELREAIDMLVGLVPVTVEPS
jgi:hypothetical protein